MSAVTLKEAPPPSTADPKVGNAGIQISLGEVDDAEEPFYFSGRPGVVAWFHANLQNAEHESKRADDSDGEPDDYFGAQY
jgi:hypothetical protein